MTHWNVDCKLRCFIIEAIQYMFIKPANLGDCGFEQLSDKLLSFQQYYSKPDFHTFEYFQKEMQMSAPEMIFGKISVLTCLL